MKFNLGRNKPAEKSMEEETLHRWRIAANRTSAQPITAQAISSPITEVIDDEDLGYPASSIRLEASEVVQTLRAEPKESKEIKIEDKSEIPYLAKVPVSNSTLTVDQDLQRRFGAKIKAAIGPGTMIEGKLSFETPVRIDGTLIGDISSTSTLIVGEQGTVQANIRVGSLVILGAVSGKVEAQELIEIRNCGHLEADIQCKRMAIEDGGHFQGRCTMIS